MLLLSRRFDWEEAHMPVPPGISIVIVVVLVQARCEGPRTRGTTYGTCRRRQPQYKLEEANRRHESPRARCSSHPLDETGFEKCLWLRPSRVRGARRGPDLVPCGWSQIWTNPADVDVSEGSSPPDAGSSSDGPRAGGFSIATAGTSEFEHERRFLPFSPIVFSTDQLTVI